MPLSPPPVRVTIAPDEDVDLAHGRRFADLRRQLADRLGRAELEFEPLYVGSTLLDDDALSGHPPLVAGALLRQAPVSDDVLSLASAADVAPWQLRVVTGPDAGWSLPLNHGQHLRLEGSPAPVGGVAPPGDPTATALGATARGATAPASRRPVSGVRALRGVTGGGTGAARTLRGAGSATKSQPPLSLELDDPLIGSVEVRLGSQRFARWPRLARFDARPRIRVSALTALTAPGQTPLAGTVAAGSRTRQNPRRTRGSRRRPAKPFRAGGTQFVVVRTGTPPQGREFPTAAHNPRNRGGNGQPLEGPVPRTGRPAGPRLLTFLAPAAVSLLMALTLRQPMFALMALSGPLIFLLSHLGRRRSGGAAYASTRSATPGHPGGNTPVRRHPRIQHPFEARSPRVGPADAVGSQLVLAPHPLVAAIRAGPLEHGADRPELPEEPFGPRALAVTGEHSSAQARLMLCAYAAAGFEVLLLTADEPHGWSWIRWLPGSRAARFEHPHRMGGSSEPLGSQDANAPVLAVALNPTRNGWLPELSRWWARSHATSHLLLVDDAEAPGVISAPAPPAWCTPLDLGSGLSERVAEQLARRLAAPGSAPSTALGSASRLPAHVPLVSMLGVPLPAASANVSGLRSSDPERVSSWLKRRWASPPPGLRAVLGLGQEGQQVAVDLPRDGPHGLIAGTTGSGKSELLQALICSLAMTYPPRDVAFALIDYKGGASFGACARLPHVVGQVTDLDPGLAQRALTGLRAELTRREHLLVEHNVPSLEALQEELRTSGQSRTGRDSPRVPDASAPPRLVIVVDEFRALADHLPDFLPGLLRIAAQGRSLGIHLVLATQRPGGVVTADMRANIGLRIALRVTDPTESRDVIDVPDAATLPAGAPGRAVLVTTTSPHRTFHSALASAPHPEDLSLVARVARPAASRSGGDGAPAGTRALPLGTPDAVPAPALTGEVAAAPRSLLVRVPESSPDALDVLVESARAAHSRSGAPVPQPAWLPALPSAVSLPTPTPGPGGGPGSGSGAPPRPVPDRTRPGLVLGLLDLPAEQRRDWAVWDLAGGHLAIEGNARSGRSTALVTLAHGALAQGMHVHVIARPEVCATLEGHPFLGTVAPPDAAQRICALLRTITELPSAPEQRSSTNAASTNAVSTNSDAARPNPAVPSAAPTQVLLIDDLEEVLAGLGQIARGAGVDALLALLRLPSVRNIHVAVATAQPLPGALRSVMTHHLVLAGTKHDDVARSIPSALAGQGGPPGRGFWFMGGSALVCQVAQTGADVLIPAGAGARPRPLRIRPIPAKVLSAQVRPGSGTGRIGVGRGGHDAGARFLDAGRGALIVGPHGSGRSSLLTHIASELALDAAAPAQRVLVIARDGPLLDVPATLRVTRFTPGALGSALEAMHELTVAQNQPGGRTVPGGHGGPNRLDPAPKQHGQALARPWTILLDDAEALVKACPLESERLVVEGPGVAVPGPHEPSHQGRGAHEPDARDGSPAAPSVLLAAATTASAANAFRGPLAVLRAQRRGVVLDPGSPGSADVFGAPLLWLIEPGPCPPGRGVLVHGRELTLLQAAHPGAAHPGAAIPGAVLPG